MTRNAGIVGVPPSVARAADDGVGVICQWSIAPAQTVSPLFRVEIGLPRQGLLETPVLITCHVLASHQGLLPALLQVVTLGVDWIVVGKSCLAIYQTSQQFSFRLVPLRTGELPVPRLTVLANGEPLAAAMVDVVGAAGHVVIFPRDRQSCGDFQILMQQV
jgi:hypothetical protein